MRFYWPIAKVAAEQRMVWGYASTETEDDQGETVTREALAAALDDYMSFANIREMHQASAVGIAKEAAVDGKGLYLAAKIVDADAWQKVVEGVYKGFSIGGRVTARDAADRRLITGLHLTEISVVDRPANPEAVFDCWKRSIGPKAGGRMTSAESGGRGPDSGVDYADPGYRPDKRKRYPLDTERHIRAAWAYIHQAHNAHRYAEAELELIKARIIAAWRAKIDRNGPLAAATANLRLPDAARKALADTSRLAQIVVALDWLHDNIAAEAATAPDGAPLPQHLQEITAELRDFVESLMGQENAAPANDSDSDDPAASELAALATVNTLRKARRADAAEFTAGLAKLAEAIMPRLDALQTRVEAIARTPLPPQTAARGFAGIAKREDGGGMPAPADDVVAALARMSEEERTLTLIKAAHANPITPGGRQAR